MSSREERYARAKIWKEQNQMGDFKKKLNRLLELAKGRAKAKGWEFSITIDDFKPTELCPLLGLPLDFSKRGKGPAPNSPTIDRIDPSIGYVPGNVWVISHKANTIKSNATLHQLEVLVTNLITKVKSCKP